MSTWEFATYCVVAGLCAFWAWKLRRWVEAEP